MWCPTDPSKTRCGANTNGIFNSATGLWWQEIQSITTSQSFWCHKMLHWEDFEDIIANHKIHPSRVFLVSFVAKAETLQEKLKVRTSNPNSEPDCWFETSEGPGQPRQRPGRPKKNGGQSERGWRQWSEERRLGWCCFFTHLKQIVAVEVPCHEVAHGILSLSWCRNECTNDWQSQNTFGVSTEGNLVWVTLCNNGPFPDTQGDPPERN